MLRSGWTGISLAAGKAELIRAVYEGLACEVKLILDEAKKAGTEIKRLKIFGGGSKSDILCRILSDFCNTSVNTVSFTEIASLGAALTAAECIGLPTVNFGLNQEIRCFKPENAYISNQIFIDYQKGRRYE